LGELGKAVAETSAAIEAYRFNDAAAAVYRFIWNVFCDWYVELAKPALQGPDGPAKDEARATTAYLLGESLKLLHPFMPFVTEALWSETAGAAGRGEILALSPWAAGAEADAAAEAEIGFVVDLVSEVRSLRSDLNVPPGAQVPLVIVGAGADVRAAVERNGSVLQRLARLSGITHAEAAPAGSAQIVVRGTVAALALGEIIDVPAAEARLTKEIEKLGQEIVKIDQKLGNPSFVERAPEEVVEEQRERKEAAAARREKLSEALGRLRAG
jgi:valyl-tRNA synthetase